MTTFFNLPAYLPTQQAILYLQIHARTPVTSHAKTTLTDIRSSRSSRLLAVYQPFTNGRDYPFKKNLHPFERLGLSVRKKMLPVRTAAASRSQKICIRSNGSGYPFGKKSYPFERLPLAVQKKSSAVRTAAASRSKKIFTRSNG